jgi:hypothetical protein
MTLTSKSAKTNQKYNEQMNQFLSAGNGPTGMATYQISIVHQQQIPSLVRSASAGNPVAIMYGTIVKSFLGQKPNKPLLCGACDNSINEPVDADALLIMLPGAPGTKPRAGSACVSPVCHDCAALDDTSLLAKAEPYLRKLMLDGRMVGAAEMSGGSGTA